MRRIRKDSSGNGSGLKGRFPDEGMNEGPARQYKHFGENEVAYLKRRREELMLEGKRDGQIARVLAVEIGRAGDSINTKIWDLKNKGQIPENSNNVERASFGKETLSLLKKRRAELILEGKNDTQISEVLGEELGRSDSAILNKIMRLVMRGELQKNPNRAAFFSKKDDTHIVERRGQLMAGGMKDGEIAKVLAKEIRRPAFAIVRRIKRLVLSEGLLENPNRKIKFSREDTNFIKSRRAELMLDGKKDAQIAGILALEMGRCAGSIEEKMRGLVKKGEIEDNPNKVNVFSENEVARIKGRRAELILEGKNDSEVARALAGELKRTVVALECRIRVLLRAGEFGENPNKRTDFSEEEISLIKKRREELILEGKNDWQVSTALASETAFSVRAVSHKIEALVKKGEARENPNKMREFGEEEIAYLKKRRAELILEGKKDAQIGRIVAAEMNRPRGSVKDRLHRFVESGELTENPNRRENFSEEEISLIMKRRAGLIIEGKSDYVVGEILSNEMKRSAGTINMKIRKLVELGKLPENPNKYGRKFSDEELAAELSSAVDMYLGDSP